MVMSECNGPAPLPGTVEALNKSYQDQEDPWGTWTISEKRIRYNELLRLLPRRPVQAAVDLCCGEGDFAVGLATIARCVSGLDCSGVVIERASQRFSTVSFEVSDVRDLARTWFARFELITWLDAIYWLTPPESEKVLQQIAEGTTGQRLTLVVSSRIIPAHLAGWFWPGHDFETPSKFLDHIRRVFPDAYSVPVQLHFNLHPFTSMSFPQRVLCTIFKILNKFGGYLVALRLAQSAWRRPSLASQVEPVVVHLAVVAERES